MEQLGESWYIFFFGTGETAEAWGLFWVGELGSQMGVEWCAVKQQV